ncbi:hypothetical protein U9M48_025025 [Paspalum notatum var. saurae]|uniref:RING-type E3 ubiquitin transferase n=1 Tax=Paspalum notatum var. saurae TaxID=547442 RepID=A0AAQ3WX48_PASNO
MDCFVRLFGLAIANALCIGGTGLLVNSLVRRARKPHSTSGMVTLSIFFVFWVSISACVYPAFCGALFPWSALGRLLAPPLRALLWLLCLPRRCARRTGHSAGDAAVAASRALQQFGGGGARVVAVDDIPAYVQQDYASKRADGPSECAVCLGEVEKGETVKRMPGCLDLWLCDHSTCPVCHYNVFVTVPDHVA